ncbi:MAG: hypothetical protein KAT17_05390, partial [Candidatus Aminicenantes bacterium]|nr:hypothetical protein [Candidatus Aminicenantes bacterium]
MSAPKDPVKYQEYLANLRESHKGQVPWMKGKHHIKENKLKMRNALKGRVSPMKGKRHSKETKRKISE